MNRAVYVAKGLVNGVLKRLGYRIERIVEADESRLDIFWLALLLSLEKVGSEFFFVQVGANDGVNDDPIREFVVRHHLAGLLIEPQPRIFLELKKNYAREPQLVFENAAVSDKDGSAKMYHSKGENGLATFRREVLEYQIGRGARIDETYVTTRTFQTLFADHSVRRVDLLQIDTEGHDYDILKLFDFKVFSPIIVRFEHIHLTRRELTEAVRLLADLGYKVHRQQIDVIAIRMAS